MQHAALHMLLYILHYHSSNVEVMERHTHAPYSASAPEGPQTDMRHSFSPMGTVNLIA